MKTPQRIPLLLAVLLALGAPSLAVPAQDAGAAAQALPSAREVIDRFVEVTKAKDAIAKTKSMHMKGKFSMAAMGMEGPMELWTAKPDLRVSSVELGAFGTVLAGYDGKVAWMTQPMIGARLLKDNELLQSKTEAAYDGVLKATELYESMKTVGRENFEGKDCYKVELVVKPLPGMDVEKSRVARTTQDFYDVASGLLIGTKSTLQGESGSGPSTTIYSDYKEFGGYLLASKSTIRASGQEIAVTIDSVEFDTATDATFALPKEVQGLLDNEAKKAQAKPQ